MMRLSALASMAERERTRALDSLARATRKGSADYSAINARIRKLEMRYEMSSAELRSRLRDGQIKETAEFAEWLFLLDARPDHVAR